MSKGEEGFCPFAYQGQIIDKETGLYYNRFRYYSPEEGLYISKDPIGLEGGIEFYGYVDDPNSFIDPFGLEEFTDSKGLSLEVKNTQNLSHLSDEQVKKLYYANNNPKGYGLSPKDANGETIILHHDKQQNSGPIIEMPSSNHDLGDRSQHPYFPSPHPTDPVDREAFDSWRKEYWTDRMKKELQSRGIENY